MSTCSTRPLRNRTGHGWGSGASPSWRSRLRTSCSNTESLPLLVQFPQHRRTFALPGARPMRSTRWRRSSSRSTRRCRASITMPRTTSSSAVRATVSTVSAGDVTGMPRTSAWSAASSSEQRTEDTRRRAPQAQQMRGGEAGDQHRSARGQHGGLGSPHGGLGTARQREDAAMDPVQAPIVHVPRHGLARQAQDRRLLEGEQPCCCRANRSISCHAFMTAASASRSKAARPDPGRLWIANIAPLDQHVGPLVRS